MCNLYSVTKGQAAIREFARAIRDTTGNMPCYPAVFPKKEAPIVRNPPDGKRELTNTFTWAVPSSSKALMEAAKKRAAKFDVSGKPYDFKELLKMEHDSGRRTSVTSRANTGRAGSGRLERSRIRLHLAR